MKDWNWPAISALVASIAAVAAVVGVCGLFRQMTQQAALARFTTGVDSLWRLDDRWDAMSGLRQKAATSLLAKKPTAEVDNVLDFFELLALLVNRQVLDSEMAWHAYYWPLAIYWAASADYVQEAQHQEGATTWEDLGPLVQTLTAIEVRKRRVPLGTPIGPTAEQIKAFLTDEMEPLKKGRK